MDGVKRDLASSLCLNCSSWYGFHVKDGGWWRPNCEHWNPKKGTEDKPYGPLSTCHYHLEHSLVDNRRGFKLSSNRMYNNYVSYLFYHLDDLTIFASPSAITCLRTDKGTPENNKKILIKSIINWINNDLKNGGRDISEQFDVNEILEDLKSLGLIS